MNQRNNFKNDNNNNTEDEMNSFNDEDEENDLFMNKKELVHIENDTSINVDKSFEDEHSKASTLKKGGLIINNISAINVQFSQGIDLSDKKMADPNFFSKQLNRDLDDFNDTEKIEPNPLNNNNREIKNNIQINPTNYFETFNNIAILSEENNNNIQKNNINNLNKISLDKKNYLDSDKNRQKKSDNFSISNFSHNYIGINPINENGESSLLLRECQNKYNQLESKYFNLNNQYKKMKNEYDEINNSNKSLLELLSYWQKFYLEVKEIVLPEEKKNNNDLTYNDYMDDPYRIQVIDEVKKLIIISRDKVYNNFYKNNIVNFAIINNNRKNNWNNKLIQNKEQFSIINNLKVKNNDIPSQIKVTEKINVGINTDNTDNNYKKTNYYFDSKNLFISKKINDYTFFEIKTNNKSTLKQDNLRTKKLISSSSNKNIYIKNKQKELQIISLEKIYIKGKPSLPRKFKKNTTYKFAYIQTDITNNNIIELLSSQKEKEKIQKQYEEKINTLNNYIKNNINENNINNNINNKNILTSRNSNNKNTNTNSNTRIFLPEMIPPENTYKIFMHCIKNFKYEEGLYQKYMIEEDLRVLKNFVEKMEKYLIGTSLPVLKSNKREDYIVLTKANNESFLQKKYKERILSGNKSIFSNINSKRRNTSDSKYENRSNSVLNNNIIFNKYKAAILSLKDI